MSGTSRLSSILLAVLLAAPVAISTGCGSSAGKPATEPAATTSLAATGELPAKTPIGLTLDAPADGALVASPPGAVLLRGTASVGAGAAAPSTIVFAVDASQAAEAPSTGTCDPGTTGMSTVLGCEIAAALSTNAKADPAKVTQVGVVIFGGGGATPAANAAVADMTAAAGPQPFAAPGADVAEVLQSIRIGEAVMFSDQTVSTASASFASGLQAAGAAAGTGPARTVVFLANGMNGSGPAVSDATFDPAVVVRAFALGDHACTDAANPFGDLASVVGRGAPGSACQRLASLADLPDLTVAQATTLQSLTVTVDGGAPVDISSAATPSLPRNGPAEVTYSWLLEGLSPGTHAICVSANGVDAGGPGSVEACATVTVATIALAPATHESELGTPDQTHTVTATVAAGSAGGVKDVPVTFSILDGPNAGQTATITTDASGQAAFTYTARQHCPGLGTDRIEACFSDAAGTKACATATQTWKDTTAPVPSAVAGPNPGGNVPGSSGKGGQNPSGFYRLLAVDAVDESPQVFLRDAVSKVVFGPFASGVTLKYTQAPGATPDQKAMGGDVAWHITGKGDAQIYARDCAGNVSDPVWALVPPGPK